MTRTHRILRQHLHTDALLGVTAVPVAAAPPQAGAPPASAPRAAAPPLPADTAHRPPPPSGGSLAASAAPPPRRAPAKTRGREEKTRLLDELDRGEVRTCTRCDLCHSRTQTVFGEGDPEARILFVGEGPGQREDELGRPFVGRSGELLDRQIEAMGLSRQDVFIANTVKCRPPNNRTPLAPEVEACAGYLRRQIEIIQPEVIIPLGGPAAKIILQTREGITRLRGVWGSYDAVDPPIPVMPTFHPAFLLRSYTKENRAKVWSDLQAAMARVVEG